MKRIAAAGVGVLAVLGILVYVVWPAVSSAGRGDDAPIRVRNGSVYIDSGWDALGPEPPQNPKKWRFQHKPSCKDDDGSLSKCLSREPESGTDAPGDTNREAALYVMVKYGKSGNCAQDASQVTTGRVTANGRRVDFWLDQPPGTPERHFSFRRNTSGFFHFRAQLSPARRFDTKDDGFTLNYKDADGAYIERLTVGRLNCSFKHDTELEILICSPWNKAQCMLTDTTK